MADFESSGSTDLTNYPKIIDDDGVQVTINSATAAVKKTYTGMSFGAAKKYRIRMMVYGGNVVPYLVIRLSSGATDSDFAEITLLNNFAAMQFVCEFTIERATDTTATVKFYTAAFNESKGGVTVANITLSGGTTWTQQDSIKLVARGSGVTEWYISQVTVTEVPV